MLEDMAGYTIFYSWQSDTPGGANRSFIRKALDDAVELLAAKAEVYDAPRVDSGMEGVAGSPEVATVMFDKIRDAGIFVGDLTLVGDISGCSLDERKRVPNPNVLLELGYAAATLGWGRVVAVMNEHFGSPKEQPFDVRNRRFPITYTLDPDAMSNRDQQLQSLRNALRGALQTAIDADYRAAEIAASRLDVSCYALIRAAGALERFSLDPQASSALVLGGALDTLRLLSAITRLLDLGLIRAVIHPGAESYEYAWTFLGREVLRQLKFPPPG